MAGFADYGLSKSTRDDVVPFWSGHVARKPRRLAVITNNYSDSKVYVERLLDQAGADCHIHSINSQITRLEKSGELVAIHFGTHMLGLARPLMLDDRDEIFVSEDRVLICVKVPSPNRLDLPVLSASREKARGLVRSLDAGEGISVKRWLAFDCERTKSMFEVVAEKAILGTSAGRTELETSFLAAVREPLISMTDLRRAKARRPKAPATR
jgi:hypothetical protein